MVPSRNHFKLAPKLLLLFVISNINAFNETNDTSTTNGPTSTSSTMYYTSTSQYYPTIEPGCGALHSFVEMILPSDSIETIPSYPVDFAPYSYILYNKSIISWPANSSPDPCDLSTISTLDVEDKVVLFHDTASCNYQQWALNFGKRGAVGLLIADSSIALRLLHGDEDLNDPRIPTRLIAYSDAMIMNDELITNENEVRVTFGCFDNDSYSEIICVTDEEYEITPRIIGAYQRQNEYDDNGHVLWMQDSDYNRHENIDYEIWFHLEFFSWVIGYENSDGSEVVYAFCNDEYNKSSSIDPTQCQQWFERNDIGNYTKKNTLKITQGLCPINSDNDISYQCIKSNRFDIDATYVQIMDGIPEWYATSSSNSISSLYYGEIFFPASNGFGFTFITTDNTYLHCILSSNDSISMNYMFDPSSCSTWWYHPVGGSFGELVIDETFDIDSNECKSDNDSIISTALLLCIEYETNEEYSTWSGLYELVDNVTIDRHSVWMLGDESYIIYYDTVDAWIITQDFDLSNYFMIADDIAISSFISSENIVSFCNDDGLTSDNPSQCMNCWTFYNDTTGSNITITVNDFYGECDVPIITPSPTEKRVTESPDSEESKEESGTGPLNLEIYEYVAIGAALLLFPICICCFVWYQRHREKGKNKKSYDADSIALQPYVPTGMAYDSYKQNQKHTQSEKKKKKEKKINKLKAPTSVQSTSMPSEGGGLDTKDDALPFINVFDEDDGMSPQDTETDDINPFLNDHIIKTGQTLIDDDGPLTQKEDIMNAFDE